MPHAIVIIGAGQAAASAAMRIRKHDLEATITIVGEEPSPPYQRPPLTKKYLSGEMELAKLLIRPAEWYTEHQVTLMTGVACTAILRDKRQVTLSDGGTLNYDNLILATGATPRALPGSIGGDLAGVYTLRSLADADAMAGEFEAGRHVLIVGGGYIGLEAAAVASSRGLKVTVVEMAERILNRVACPATADWFRTLHGSHGVRIREGTGLNLLTGVEGRVTSAQLDDGASLDVDFVITGIGITPNVHLAESAGLDIDNGIAVDEFGRSSDPSIYAAGDCASFEFNGERIRLESVQNAVDQAEVVADHVCGESRSYHPLPRFWSDQYDIRLQIIGLARNYDATVTRPGKKPGSLSAWYYRGEQLIAVDAMADPIAYVMAMKALDKGINVPRDMVADGASDIGGFIKARAG